MPIRPIDIALTAPRSQEASLTHFSHNKQVEHAQQQAGNQFSQQVEQNNRQTVETEKEQWPDYLKKDSKKNASQQGQQKKKKEQEEEKKKDAIGGQSTFDVKI